MFVKGVFVFDFVGFFNLSLDGNMCCVIDFCEGDKVNEKVLKVFI